MNRYQRRRRHSMRLQGYDYSSAGVYFVTTCVQGRECLLGEVVNGEMQLSQFGEIVAAGWEDLPAHYPDVELDDWVIMPNHVHGIVVLEEAGVDGVGSEGKPTRRHGLSEVVRGFKTWTARDINELRGMKGARVWQRNFYDHVVRNEKALWTIRQYIENNPFQWEIDQLHPEHPSKW